jgi:endonuclease/exonuclease/phosphatase family metal-dependent hydrolase
MKNLSWFNKVVLWLNIVLTVLTIIAYILPFMAPKIFPLLSVFTLIMPLMLVFNAIFFVYWLLQLKRQMLLSGIVLLLGITFVNKFYRFSAKVIEVQEEDFTLMSYNVRLFNLYKWLPDTDIPQRISAFVNDQDPDIVCLQEYNKLGDSAFSQYRHSFIFTPQKQSGHAIFSRYPIINTGDIQFPGSANNVVYADIKKGTDTLRVYSMHLQSIKISPDIHENIDEQKGKVIFYRISEAFKRQQLQAEIIREHKNECRYPMVICGDLNNSAFSYVYRIVRGDMNDAFEQAGSGFGRSYNYKYYPARIDYIFADKALEVKQFETFSKFVNSDHYPIITRLGFVSDNHN